MSSTRFWNDSETKVRACRCGAELQIEYRQWSQGVAMAINNKLSTLTIPEGAMGEAAISDDDMALACCATTAARAYRERCSQ